MTSQRHLVGMTNGAKKRAARAVVPWGTDLDEVVLEALARWSYRVGERLRPCLGCPGCHPGATPEQVYHWVHERARVPRLRAAYWFREPDDGDDYCRDCIDGLIMLPGLVVCSLLHLFGHDMHAPRHGPGWCRECGYYCRSAPAQIAWQADDARDGGWAIERDSWITCDGCGADLDFCPTDYFVESELEHWEEHGPPRSGRGWWEILVSLDAMINYWMPAAATDKGWASVTALMGKWGCDGSGVVQCPC